VKRNLFNKSVAVFVSLLMVFSAVVPLGVFAGEEEQGQQNVEDETYHNYDEDLEPKEYYNNYEWDDSDPVGCCEVNYPHCDEVSPMAGRPITLDPSSVTICTEYNFLLNDYTVVIIDDDTNGLPTGTVHVDTSALPSVISVELDSPNIMVFGERPAVGQPDIVGAFDVLVTYDGAEAILTINVNLPAMQDAASDAYITLSRPTVTVNDAGLMQTVEVYGTATGEITFDFPLDWPQWVTISAVGSVLNLTGERPPAGTPAINRAFNVTVIRGGAEINLTVTINLTAQSAAFVSSCICGVIQLSISSSGANFGTITAARVYGTIGASCRQHFTIPAQIAGIPVLGIGNGIFRNILRDHTIEEITLPSTLLTIGNHAFAGHSSPEHPSSLRRINLNQGLQTIGLGAFYRTSLTEITIPNSVTRIMSGNGATATVVPNVMGTTTANRTFGHTPSLRNITIGTGLARLEPGIFYDASGLESITVPGNVLVVGEGAFRHAGPPVTGIGSVSIPFTLQEGVQEIHRGAFFGVPIAELVIPDSVERIMSGSNALYTPTVAQPWVYGTTTVNENHPLATQAQLNDRWHRAFGHNPHLTSVTIGSGLNRLEAGIFYETPHLNEIEIPGTVHIIGERAFRMLGTSATYGRGIRDLTLHEGVQQIHRGAFFGAPIEVLNIPDSVTRIISGTNGEITATGTNHFLTRYGTTLNPDPVPPALPADSQLQNRWHRSFGHNVFLREINIGTGLRIIEPGLFYNSFTLERLHLGSVNDIRLRAFHNAGNPNHIVPSVRYPMLPNFPILGTDRPGEHDFYRQNNIGLLRNITWNAGMYEHGVLVHTYAFRGDRTVIGTNIPYPQINNVCDCCRRLRWSIYRSGGAVITEFLDGPGITSLTIPGRVNTTDADALTFRSVGYHFVSVAPLIRGAFEGTPTLQRIYLPDTILTIRDRAFFAATQLQHIGLQEGLRTIGRGAFFDTGLRTLTIPDSVIRIHSGYAPLNRTTIHGIVATPPDLHPTNHLCEVGRPGRPDRPSPCLTRRSEFHWGVANGPNWTIPGNRTAVLGRSYGRQLGGINPPQPQPHPATATAHTQTFAFGRNHALHTINIGENSQLEVLEPGTFYDARALHTVSLGNVRIIGTSAFEFRSVASGNETLNITWSPRLEVIGPRAFYGAAHIRGIDFEEYTPWLWSIGQRAFRGASRMAYLNLNDFLYVIHRGAFNNASALEELVIPDSVRRIFSGGDFTPNASDQLHVPVPGTPASAIGLPEDATFGGASVLTSVTIGNGHPSFPNGSMLDHIRPGTFRNALLLESVDLGRVQTIGAFAFENAPVLDEIIWGEAVNHIHNNAFERTRIRGGIRFPDTLITIHAHAFADAFGLEELVLNYRLQTIENGAFRNAHALRGQPVCVCSPVPRSCDICIETFRDDENHPWHLYIPASVVTINSANTAANRTFGNAHALEAIHIGNGLTDINAGTFYGARVLQRIHIGNGVSTIGHSAFSGAVQLYDISWGTNPTLQSIGQYAFLNMGNQSGNITYLIFPARLTSIGPGAFRGANSLRIVEFPHWTSPDSPGLATIGAGAFFGASSLDEVIIPDSVTTFNSADGANLWTFGNNTSLRRVVIGEGIHDIPASAFRGATNLETVDLGTTVQTIGANAFLGTGLQKLELPDSVMRIYNFAFADSPRLERLVLNDGLTTIGQGAFRNATNLRGKPVNPNNPGGPWHLVIPDSVNAINSTAAAANRAFGGATSLEAVDVGGGILTIQPETFFGATSLRSLNLRNVQTIENGAFRGAAAANPIPLEEIQMDAVITIGANAFRYNSGLEALVTPEGLTTIGNHAFSGASNLSRLTLNEGLETIGMGAFSNATSLSGVLRIPSSVTTINSGTGAPDRTFGGLPSGTPFVANSLNSVIIGDNVTTINPGTFAGSGISSITIGTGVQTIGAAAFSPAANLSTVTFFGDAPAIQATTFAPPANRPEGFAIRYISGMAWDIRNQLWHPHNLPVVPIDGNVPIAVVISDDTPSALSRNEVVQLNATVYNQFGPMTGVSVVWRITGGTGATITSDGLLTVNANASPGFIFFVADAPAANLTSAQHSIRLAGAPFDLSFSHPEVLTFPRATEDYEEQPTQTFRITNTGAELTGTLTVALGDGASNFEIVSPSPSPATINTILPGSGADVAIRPVTGLDVGTHTAELIIYGDNFDPHTVELRFTVSDDLVVPFGRTVFAFTQDPNAETIPAAQLLSLRQWVATGMFNPTADDQRRRDGFPGVFHNTVANFDTMLYHADGTPKGLAVFAFTQDPSAGTIPAAQLLSLRQWVATGMFNPTADDQRRRDSFPGVFHNTVANFNNMMYY